MRELPPVRGYIPRPPSPIKVHPDEDEEKILANASLIQRMMYADYLDRQLEQLIAEAQPSLPPITPTPLVAQVQTPPDNEVQATPPSDGTETTVTPLQFPTHPRPPPGPRPPTAARNTRARGSPSSSAKTGLDFNGHAPREDDIKARRESKASTPATTETRRNRWVATPTSNDARRKSWCTTGTTTDTRQNPSGTTAATIASRPESWEEETVNQSGEMKPHPPARPHSVRVLHKRTQLREGWDIVLRTTREEVLEVIEPEPTEVVKANDQSATEQTLNHESSPGVTFRAPSCTSSSDQEEIPEEISAQRYSRSRFV
nr:uncharacterized protein LOC129259397 [Lytechinus pictus]